MKFTCQASEIKEKIQTLARVSQKTGLDPIFECIYIQNEDHNLTLRAANTEIIAEQNTPIKGEINGSCLVNATLLSKVLLNISKSSDVVTFEKVDNVLRIQNNKNHTDIDLYNESMFPKIQNGGDKILSIQKDILINIIKSVAFCAATTEIKPEIASVYLYIKDGKIYTAATDSYRLAEKHVFFESDSQLSMLIPQKNINQILSILDQEKENDLDIIKNGDHIIFETKSSFISTRLTEGSFPDYKQLFPKDFEFSFSVRKEVLQNALELSSIISNQTPICSLEYNNETQSINISSEEKGVGQMTKEVPVKSEHKENIKVFYNSNYFLEGLSKINGDNVVLKFTTVNRPLFIENQEDLSFVYLLMPINR
jgi:DNA polymerase-3 subunit beta